MPPTTTDIQAAELASLPAPHLAPSAPLATSLYRLTVKQYDKMVQDGTLEQNNRVELIEGLLLSKMGRNRPHVVAAKQGFAALSAIVPPGWHVAKEDPITVSNWSKPEPDLAIIRGQARDYLHHDVTPADVALVVEIAESSLSADRLEMHRLYATSNIPAYWIVNLVEAQIEVYTDSDQSTYQQMTVYKPGQEIPLVIDGIRIDQISATDLLP
jgi:Uma2 family endonuclease